MTLELAECLTAKIAMPREYLLRQDEPVSALFLLSRGSCLELELELVPKAAADAEGASTSTQAEASTPLPSRGTRAQQMAGGVRRAATSSGVLLKAHALARDRLSVSSPAMRSPAMRASARASARASSHGRASAERKQSVVPLSTHSEMTDALGNLVGGVWKAADAAVHAAAGAVAGTAEVANEAAHVAAQVAVGAADAVGVDISTMSTMEDQEHAAEIQTRAGMRVLRVLHQFDSFHEEAFLSQKPSPVSVQAVTYCHLMLLTTRAFEKIRRHHPTLDALLRTSHPEADTSCRRGSTAHFVRHKMHNIKDYMHDGVHCATHLAYEAGHLAHDGVHCASQLAHDASHRAHEIQDHAHSFQDPTHCPARAKRPLLGRVGLKRSSSATARARPPQPHNL